MQSLRCYSLPAHVVYQRVQHVVIVFEGLVNFSQRAFVVRSIFSLICYLCACRTPRISPSLTVLAEQTAGGRRGRVAAATDEPPPPPTGPRSHRSATHRTNGTPAHFPPPDKHTNASGQQWKRYTDSPGVGSPPPPPPAPSSPTSSRRDRERRSSPHGSSGSSGVNNTPTSNGGAAVSSTKDKKVRGVPQSFGYVKRGSTSTSTSTTTSTNGHHAVTNGTNGVGVGVGVGTPPTISNGNGKTAQVSAVPRTKVKVSGGTQTCSSDLQPHSKLNFVYFNKVNFILNLT